MDAFPCTYDVESRDAPTTAMWSRRGPPRCLHSRATCRGGVGGVGVVKAARRRLLMIAIAILLCPKVARHTAPAVNDPVPVIRAVCESDFLVNGTVVPSGDVQFSNFTMQGTLVRKADFDPILLHSVALQSKHSSFKAAVLQLISWLAKTMIMAWNLLWSSNGAKDACKQAESCRPDLPRPFCWKQKSEGCLQVLG